MSFSQIGDPVHQEDYHPKKHASKAAREFVKVAKENGSGPTAAYEDALLEFGEDAPTLASVRKAANPGSKTIPAEMELLCVLRRTYAATLNPHTPVPGYVQVSWFVMIS